jgi:hypothetical protein
MASDELGLSGEKCLFCRRPLGERGKCEEGLCLPCAAEVEGYLARFGLMRNYKELAIAHLWQIGFALNRYGRPESRDIPQLLLNVPTYYGSIPESELPSPAPQEFDTPYVPVLACRSEGVRIVLGSHEFLDTDFPDVQIERRPKGWAIFLHPLGGGDPSGYVYFLDDGRSYVFPETGVTPPIEFRESSGDTMRELDSL